MRLKYGATGANLTYDGNGNLLGPAASTPWVWDAQNRLVTADNATFQ